MARSQRQRLIMITSLLRIIWKMLSIIDLILYTAWIYVLTFLPHAFRNRIYPKRFQRWCQIFCKALNVKLHVHEHYQGQLPEKYIVIANHPSLFEDIGMPAIFNAKFLSKAEVRNWWIGGRIAEAAGTLFFNREDKAARKQARIDIKNTIGAGHSIGLYPEGGCKGRRIYTPFTHGAFDLSIETNTPIIPVFIYYEAQATFEWQNQTVLQKIWQIFTARNAHAHYYIYDPIYPQQFTHSEHLRHHVETFYRNMEVRLLM